jgi:hypothetical protein
VTVNTHTNNNNNLMILTSAQLSASEILQQSLPLPMAKYINLLAATIIERDAGYTDNDHWDAHAKLKVVPRDSICV